MLAHDTHAAAAARCSPADTDRPRLPLPCPGMQYTMRVLQGGIIGSALIAFVAALLGAFLWLLK